MVVPTIEILNGELEGPQTLRPISTVHIYIFIGRKLNPMSAPSAPKPI
jgi:hypothetical protein